MSDFVDRFAFFQFRALSGSAVARSAQVQYVEVAARKRLDSVASRDDAAESISQTSRHTGPHVSSKGPRGREKKRHALKPPIPPGICIVPVGIKRAGLCIRGSWRLDQYEALTTDHTTCLALVVVVLRPTRYLRHEAERGVEEEGGTWCMYVHGMV